MLRYAYMKNTTSTINMSPTMTRHDDDDNVDNKIIEYDQKVNMSLPSTPTPLVDSPLVESPSVNSPLMKNSPTLTIQRVITADFYLKYKKNFMYVFDKHQKIIVFKMKWNYVLFNVCLKRVTTTVTIEGNNNNNDQEDFVIIDDAEKKSIYPNLSIEILVVDQHKITMIENRKNFARDISTIKLRHFVELFEGSDVDMNRFESSSLIRNTTFTHDNRFLIIDSYHKNTLYVIYWEKKRVVKSFSDVIVFDIHRRKNMIVFTTLSQPYDVMVYKITSGRFSSSHTQIVKKVNNNYAMKILKWIGDRIVCMSNVGSTLKILERNTVNGSWEKTKQKRVSLISQMNINYAFTDDKTSVLLVCDGGKYLHLLSNICGMNEEANELNDSPPGTSFFGSIYKYFDHVVDQYYTVECRSLHFENLSITDVYYSCINNSFYLFNEETVKYRFTREKTVDNWSIMSFDNTTDV